MDLANNIDTVSSLQIPSSCSPNSTTYQLVHAKIGVPNGLSMKQDKHPTPTDLCTNKGCIKGNGLSTFLSHNSTNNEEKQVGRAFEDYKKKVRVILEEYFQNDDISFTCAELHDIGMPNNGYYFVKKLVSMAMDRRDKEKEMAAMLLSSLYGEVMNSQQVYEGFCKLVESADDLFVDIPDVVEVLAVFIARAVVDDILPPAFLLKQAESLPEASKGMEVVRRAQKGYLSTPYHGEVLERKWGFAKTKSADTVRARIHNLLTEYVVSGDKKEACRCIKEVHVPFFHHEIVKQAILMGMERQKVEARILDLLKMCEEESVINSSQISKGFSRLINNIDDLCLDIPNAREILQSLILKAASGGWLHASSLRMIPRKPKPLEGTSLKLLKMKAQTIVQEYFMSGNVYEVCVGLEEAASDLRTCSQLNSIFVKRLINLGMDRKNREKEMASILLCSLCLPVDDLISGFVMLIDCADDTALDNPVVVDDLAMFLARAVVDEVLPPSHLGEIESYCIGSNSIGNNVIPQTKSLLNARLAAERILRCWGGIGDNNIGWSIEEAKDKIGKLLEEYEGGGGFREACRCIKELGMPFFHHEIVKKVLVWEIDKRNDRLWGFLDECFKSGLITMNQMSKGFGRVVEALDDLVLDVPDARPRFCEYVHKAKDAGWLEPSFSSPKPQHAMQNGSCP